MTICPTGSQRSLNNGQLAIEFVTVTLKQGNNATGVDRDILVQFKAPHKFFMIASITAVFAGSNIFLHFTPLGYPVANGGAIIAPSGGDHWIPISVAANSQGRCEGRWIRFTRPIMQFFIDADHAANNAAAYLITFIGCDDIEDVVAERT